MVCSWSEWCGWKINLKEAKGSWCEEIPISQFWLLIWVIVLPLPPLSSAGGSEYRQGLICNFQHFLLARLPFLTPERLSNPSKFSKIHFNFFLLMGKHNSKRVPIPARSEVAHVVLKAPRIQSHGSSPPRTHRDLGWRWLPSCRQPASQPLGFGNQMKRRAPSLCSFIQEHVRSGSVQVFSWYPIACPRPPLPLNSHLD